MHLSCIFHGYIANPIFIAQFSSQRNETAFTHSKQAGRRRASLRLELRALGGGRRGGAVSCTEEEVTWLDGL